MAGKRKLSARSLRFLFARGVLKGKGSGKDRKVTYNKNAGKSRSERIAAGRKIANTPEVARKALKGSGLRVGRYKNSQNGKDPLTATGSRAAYKGDTRFLVKTARSEGKLKSRWGDRGRKVPSKAERDKTRASRIEEGRAMAAYGVRKAAFRQNRSPQARDLADRGYTLSVQSSARRRADGMKSTKAAARMIQTEKKQARAEARGNRIRAARQAAGRNPKVQKFRAMEETLGRDGALRALKNRSQRIAAGRTAYEAFKTRRNSLYSGSLF